MSTIKVDEIYGDQPTDAVDLPNKLKIGGASVEQGYTASGSEPSSPSNGDFWWDTGNDKLYRYMDSGFKELGIPPATTYFGDRAHWASGGRAHPSPGGNTTQIDYWDITSLGNAAEFGDCAGSPSGD